MADVSRPLAGDGDERDPGERHGSGRDRGDPDRDDRSRGQVLLVAGLAVAVTLVALVLLLNTVIYTQNLATRGTAVEDGEAVAFRSQAKAGVGAAIDAENRAGYDDLDTVEKNVRDAVARYDNLSSRYAAGRGTVADVEEGSLTDADMTDGTLVYQTNASRNFTSLSEKTTWKPVEDVESIRRFRATVARENLTNAISPPAGFSVRLTGSDGDSWQVHVYNDSGGDGDGHRGITVAVDSGGSLTEVCSVSEPTATVDFTAGRLDASNCPGFEFAEGLEAPYEVEFVDANEVTGTYELTVEKPPSDEDISSDLAGPNAGESPRAVHAVYSAEVELYFETPDLRFHTTVRVARGEPA